MAQRLKRLFAAVENRHNRRRLCAVVTAGKVLSVRQRLSDKAIRIAAVAHRLGWKHAKPVSVTHVYVERQWIIVIIIIIII